MFLLVDTREFPTTSNLSLDEISIGHVLYLRKDKRLSTRELLCDFDSSGYKLLFSLNILSLQCILNNRHTASIVQFSLSKSKTINLPD